MTSDRYAMDDAGAVGGRRAAAAQVQRIEKRNQELVRVLLLVAGEMRGVRPHGAEELVRRVRLGLALERSLEDPVHIAAEAERVAMRRALERSQARSDDDDESPT